VDVQYRLSADAPERVTADSFAVTVDLSEYEMARSPELQSLPVKVTSLQQGVEVLEFQPTTVPVALDRLAEAQVPVAVETGDLPEGLAISAPRTSHEEVTASGPQSQLNRVDRAVARVQIFASGIDVRQPQVLVEAMVVTLTDNQTRSLGIEMQKRGVHDDIQYQLSSLFGLGSPDPTFGSLLPAAGTGFGGVVLDPGNFSAIVRALETVNEGRSLAMPKMLVDNNQAASLDSVLQTPYSSTNASNTVATTSFGGTLDAGTQIEVTPQIASGGQLLLDYSISLSSFTGVPSDPSLPPPRQQNKLKSVATVPDGYTVVVGGLELTTDSNMRSSVPILGDLPLIGALFSSQSKSENRARFFVFLRCNVMRATGFEDLKYATQKDLAVAAVDDGQPKLKPRIMR